MGRRVCKEGDIVEEAHRIAHIVHGEGQRRKQREEERMVVRSAGRLRTQDSGGNYS